MRLVCLPIVLVLVGFHALGIRSTNRATPESDRRMSFHNRLLLNRAVVSKLKSIEVLVLAAGEARPDGFILHTEEIAALARHVGGRVVRAERDIGYLRIEMPTERLLELVASPAIAAYQIASLSKASWYRDGPPMSNAEMFRGFEVAPIAATEPSDTHAGLPSLSTAASREPGYTADDDVGIGEWMAEHPTFDGRGVTIALVETALPSFTDPTLRPAKTLDGRDVPKIAGILNTLGPADRDDTRVLLDTEVQVDTSWARVWSRTYVLPRPGAYRAGLLRLPAGSNLVHQFCVLEHEETREVWIDSNGDASFQDETPLADVNERFEPRLLKLTHPRKADVSFVMGRGREPNTVHIYIGRGSHQAMTVGVAAGSRTEKSLAYGVAPNARVLLVRNHGSDYELDVLLEGFIDVAKRPDVDVISSSAGITMVPDTAADFGGLLFQRLADVYRKPVLLGAGNTHSELATSKALGAALTVGGSLGPATAAALHGGRPLEGLMVHRISAAGPSIDGAIKPDFLAPMERLAVDLPWNRGLEAVPRNAPTHRLPAGYQISCCTSASSPYAAGVAALLISAAKQQNVPYSTERLARALRLSSRFLPGFGSHEQGNGVLDVAAAWRALIDYMEVPRIVASARIVHPLARYAARGSEGQGIFEFEGWTAGMSGTREIRLRRESGPQSPISYQLTWIGNDGTFHTAPRVMLPLGRTIAVPVTIAPKTTGVHSALLNLHDASKTIVFRTQATIVAADRIDEASGSVRITGRLGPMRINSHYIHVPAGAGAISFDVDVIQGVVAPSILPAHGLFPGYYPHVHPGAGRYLGKGRHTVLIPNPEAGTWAIHLDNSSLHPRFPDDPTPADDRDAEYVVTMRILGAAVRPAASSAGSIAIEATNLGSAIREPVFMVSPATLKTHRATFNANGMPHGIEVSVPDNAAALSLQLRSEQPAATGVELYLYDCTTGECFAYDIAFPAAGAQSMVVRRPKAGRWVAAVNPAPFPTAGGAFVLEEIVATGTPRQYKSKGPRVPGARWTETIESLNPAPAPAGPEAPLLLIELIDAAAERDEAVQRWDPRPEVPERMRLRDRPVALGSAIYLRQ